MRRLASPAILIAGLALVAASPPNRSVFSVHQPVVTHTDYVFDVQTDGYGHLARGEAIRVADWLGMLGLDYGDHVSVDGDGGRDDVAAIVSRWGLLLDKAPPVTAGSLPAGTARVIVSRSHATVTGCPDWSRPSVPNWSGESMSDYGCATAGNLAQMVANPDDLVRGQSGALGGSDPQTVGKAIKLYRDQPATGTQLKQETTGGGK